MRRRLSDDRYHIAAFSRFKEKLIDHRVQELRYVPLGVYSLSVAFSTHKLGTCEVRDVRPKQLSLQVMPIRQQAHLQR